MSDELYHYGTKEHSGRYPWGSGENPYQRLGRGSLRARVKELEDQGLTRKEIAESMKISSGELTDLIAIEKDKEKWDRLIDCRKLHEKGLSNVAIADKLGMTEGTVRNYLKEDAETRISELKNVTDELKKQVQTKRFIDIGEGAQYALDCKETKMGVAVKKLQLEEGYEVHNLWVDQLGTSHKTTMKILCEPGTDKKYLYDHLDEIHSIDESRVIKTNGEIKLGMEKPNSINRDRIMVRYGDEGGSDKDGVIEIRRGVEDISLGKANYAQVRIAVDDKMYMKGMAVYSDNMPPGVDVIYNTNRKTGTPDLPTDDSSTSVFKKLKLDDDNPFGATIKGLHDNDAPAEDQELKLCQRYYVGKDGKEHLSAINVVNEEGTWGEWSKTLSSQFLSKQNQPLVKSQLDIQTRNTKADFDDIMSLTEPTVKKALLEDFADQCDAAAAQLKAAALPRQRTSVILPVPSLKDNEVYAPQYKTGEHICLVRHPHGGTFEIPELVVNNNHKEGKATVGNAVDAIGINIKTAEKLSGADFDGDTVICIPSDHVKIKTSPTPEALKGFDPKTYKLPDTMHKDPKTGEMVYDYPTIKNKTKQTEMGRVSNLITDMTIMGADEDEIVRAVKHSMVVIDSEKHRLDYKKSEKDFGIAELKAKYQGRANGGGTTIVSQAGARADEPEHKDYYDINPKTGEKIYKLTGKAIKDKDGKIIGYEQREYEKINKIKNDDGTITYEPSGKMEKATTRTKRMYTEPDAMALTSDKKGGYPVETLYANYANQMKALANQARKETLAIKPREYSPSAAQTYAKEVASLEAKLLIAKKNAPRERLAQLQANAKIKTQFADHPEWKDDPDKKKKIKGQALASARAQVGAKKQRITFTDKEWEALQSGALRKNMLREVITNSDKDEVKKRSMPKDSQTTLSTAKINAIKALLAKGYPQSDIAARLGVSVTTVNKISTGNR